ncbi:hypothetical protein [Vibrio marisflavi]|uniref:YrhK domain-containing protein n=1 Tax=Vibrio marisflavi CECT 7928 TaxID=634439 RepID=A0ABN8E0Q2_9VIBR|nr:hypothetical protein [Vibrio marisflavi]CAH0536973.1 hypothetical protein VMF7928_00843 [Vibrio marisflavi CECT 7928]
MKLHYPHFDNKYQHHEHKYFRGFRVELKLLVGEKLKVWNARRHRKGFNLIGNEHHETANPLVLLNLPIAILFIVGSAHFIFASLLQLEWLSFQTHFDINTIFFYGSIFFTSAAYIQYLQAINGTDSVDTPPNWKDWKWFAIQPHRIGFWSTFTQFAGTLLFNVSTFAAIFPASAHTAWIFIWGPDFIGSILFLVSGYLAVVESDAHVHYWPKTTLSSVITVFNLWGCLFFMISAFMAVPSIVTVHIMLEGSLATTALGGVCFMASSFFLAIEK